MTDSIEINSLTGREILGGKPNTKIGTNGHEEYKKIRKACKQLSQLTAWMWLEGDKGEDDRNRQAPELQKRYLRILFDTILKYQAFYNDRWGSKAIAQILIGENEAAVSTLQESKQDKPPERSHQICPNIIPEIPSLTLQQVYEELVPSNDYNDYVFDQNFTEDYYAKVSIETYEGSIFYDFFGTNNPTKKPKYIVVIPYPPKPKLGRYTVNTAELEAWATQPTTVEEKSYIPPNFNPYIPIQGCSC